MAPIWKAGSTTSTKTDAAFTDKDKRREPEVKPSIEEILARAYKRMEQVRRLLLSTT